ncbi:hypothetical protein [Brucella anthropi]|uniref:Uncharacterized protein n=1 Tax=Brucella anthropi TaxID=529 RepID=A0A6L3ZBY4_BRUAN|nr:hypothetical protein [Brucella anthropi]KAB2773590.1 hypothetical protein F9L04_01805 [Brucella anthropi]
MSKIAELSFTPHAIILTAYSIPRPIFAAALIKADKFKRIDFLPDSNPLTYVKQVLDRLPEGVPCFGKTTGFVINYTPDKAIQFNIYGKPIKISCKYFAVGDVSIRI